jgi:SAM-dependent methyltransferase
VPEEVWATAAAYEPYIGRWSRAVAREFVRWLGLPTGARWLEVGCGTGALTRALHDLAGPARLTALDRSRDYARYARAQLYARRAGWIAADAGSLPVRAASADAAVSGLVLNFLPDAGVGISEMRRAVRKGGAVAAYVWDYAEGMELIRRFWDAAVALDPGAESLDEARRFPMCQPRALADLWSSAGLEQVEARAIVVPTTFARFDDYWRPFLGGQGPAPGYVMSLDEERRAALRERLRATLPMAPDGRIRLVARAWAVRGWV